MDFTLTAVIPESRACRPQASPCRKMCQKVTCPVPVVWDPGPEEICLQWLIMEKLALKGNISLSLISQYLHML